MTEFSVVDHRPLGLPMRWSVSEPPKEISIWHLITLLGSGTPATGFLVQYLKSWLRISTSSSASRLWPQKWLGASTCVIKICFCIKNSNRNAHQLVGLREIWTQLSKWRIKIPLWLEQQKMRYLNPTFENRQHFRNRFNGYRENVTFWRLKIHKLRDLPPTGSSWKHH